MSDDVPPTEYLMMETLAARHRLGESLWTFPTAVTRAARALEARGWVGWKSGVTERTIRVWLTDAGVVAWKLNLPYQSPRQPLLPTKLFYEWLAFDDEAGISARTIVATVTGERRALGRWRMSEPLDAGDMRRCLLVVDKHPMARNHFGRVAALSPTWKRIIEAWDQLEGAINAEFPEWTTPQFTPDGGWRGSKFASMVDKVLKGEPS